MSISTVQKCVRDNTGNSSPVNFRICIYFDGTLNNRTNVKLGKLGNIKDDSYRCELSNVAKLIKYWTEDNKANFSFSIYVEGIGTRDNNTDDIEGSGTGMGKTGIIAKVESGIKQIIEEIDVRMNSLKNIGYIYFDTFGFSRGAAAARHFVHVMLLNDGNSFQSRLVSKGYTVSSVKSKFVGLFDTVASYGLDYDDNTEQLGLNSIKSAEYTVQLVAAEEHRKNFRLTNIRSAGKKGMQIYLPGAHADVGGGYNETDEANEIDRQIFDLDRAFGLTDADKAAFVRERNWLLTSGWYRNNEIHEVSFWNELKVSRFGIKNSYSRILVDPLVKTKRGWV
jgi:uncharacterized protein (DUF2235 family)